jgi:DNA-binding PadR family transcriptional regulator
MYEFLVLGRLSRQPMHGYLIAKVLDFLMGPFRHCQWGALYPVLSRLEREGLIRAEECPESDDGRPRKVYSITEAGRERLHELLMDTSAHRGEYDTVFYLKVGLFDQLTRAERLYLTRDYSVYAQQNVDHLSRKRRELIENRTLPEDATDCVLAVLDHRIEYWRNERGWAEQLIEQNQQKEAV